MTFRRMTVGELRKAIDTLPPDMPVECLGGAFDGYQEGGGQMLNIQINTLPYGQVLRLWGVKCYGNDAEISIDCIDRT